MDLRRISLGVYRGCKVTNFSVKPELRGAPGSTLQPDNQWCLLSNLLHVLSRVQLVINRGVIIIRDGDPSVVDILVDFKSIYFMGLWQWIVIRSVGWELLTSKHLNKACKRRCSEDQGDNKERSHAKDIV